MEGLRRKPTYNEIVNYLEFDQPKVKYPDRTATCARASQLLTQLYGIGIDAIGRVGTKRK